ncbi:uncharacterized protein LOC108344414 [Vigna angularis]|uniref:uncharacterized protein LOC108344414 n=1 Tax=Phaseolus angularis TaxID=3914 RepID=UPI000809D7A3|nr:uncharacterized protein LOC108344414 [Vigna angularis]
MASIPANLNSVSVLNGTKFKDWKENIEIILGCMDLDLTLRIEKPPSLKYSSTSSERREYEKLDRSNRMCLMFIKRDIPEVYRGTVYEEITSAKDFLAEIEKRFVKSEKVEASELLQSLASMRKLREHKLGLGKLREEEESEQKHLIALKTMSKIASRKHAEEADSDSQIP